MYEVWSLVWPNIEVKKEEGRLKRTLEEATYDVGGKIGVWNVFRLYGGGEVVNKVGILNRSKDSQRPNEMRFDKGPTESAS